MIAGNLRTKSLKMNGLNQILCKSPLYPRNSKQTSPVIIHSNLRRLATCTYDDSLPASVTLEGLSHTLRWLKYS